MAHEELSAKQREILEFIKSEILSRGYPPAVRDICEAVHLKSTSSVHAHLTTLEKKGYIRKDPSKPRAIEITDEEFIPLKRELVNIPIVGTVAAGLPLLAEQNISSYFPIPSEYLPNVGTFMLRVRGESMKQVGINDGDIIIAAEQQTAKNGDIVVALIDDSATVKTFYREDGYIRLQPENDTMEPIIVRDELRILGKVIGLLRFYN